MEKMKDFEPIRADILVVGGGGADIRTAIEADKQGAKTVLIDKLLPGKRALTMDKDVRIHIIVRISH